MPRSDVEKATNDAIEAAIDAYREAYRATHPNSVHGTLVDWIVVAAETKADMSDPDEDVTAYSIIMPGGGIPWYRGRGLLEAGIAFMSGTETEPS